MIYYNIVAGKLDRSIPVAGGKDAKIRQLKETIEGFFGIAVARQTLKYMNQVLEDDNTFEYYYLGELMTPPPRIHLFVTPLPPYTEIPIQLVELGTDRCYDALVGEKTLVGDLKRNFVEVWGVDVDRVQLSCHLEEMNDDDATLSEYLIHEDVRVVFAIDP